MNRDEEVGEGGQSPKESGIYNPKENGRAWGVVGRKKNEGGDGRD